MLGVGLGLAVALELGSLIGLDTTASLFLGFGHVISGLTLFLILFIYLSCFEKKWKVMCEGEGQKIAHHILS